VTADLNAPGTLRLDIPLDKQRLFGFLLDSVEGLATHSRAQDSEQLEVWITAGQEQAFQDFMRAWDAFQSRSREQTPL